MTTSLRFFKENVAKSQENKKVQETARFYIIYRQKLRYDDLARFRGAYLQLEEFDRLQVTRKIVAELAPDWLDLVDTFNCEVVI